MRFLTFLLPALFLVACKPKQYTPYSGVRVWPIKKGAASEQIDGLPVYQGFPERPYDVVGTIRLANSHRSWGKGDTDEVIRLAKSNGAEGLVVSTGESFSAMYSPEADPHLFSAAERGAVAIKWKPANLVADASHRLDGFRYYIRRSYPRLDLDSKMDLWQMGIEYIGWLGLDIDSDQGTARLENTFSSIAAVDPGSGKSTWLFKGTIRASGSPASPSERFFFGKATLTQAGENITLVSNPSEPAILQFAGQLKDKKLEGKVTLSAGAASYDGNISGSFSASKITLEGQADANKEIAAFNLILLR